MASETVLIVDDEKEIADLLALYLKNEGFDIRKYYDPQEALDCVRNGTVSLAFLMYDARYGRITLLRQNPREVLLPGDYVNGKGYRY